MDPGRSPGRSGALIRAAGKLNRCLSALKIGSPAAYVYNPLEYAERSYRRYLERFAGDSGKRVLFLGMNPGPWGMAQTGVPFGDVGAVREWMGIEEEVGRPPAEHPRRPVLGFRIPRGEVSGRRLWGLMEERFGSAESFFREHFVGNYCPLLFLNSAGRNITPDKLRAADRQALYSCCDEHLAATIETLTPDWLIGVGRFGEARLRAVNERGGGTRKVAGILHPSPASPAANRDWKGQTAERLVALGVWGKRDSRGR